MLRRHLLVKLLVNLVLGLTWLGLSSAFAAAPQTLTNLSHLNFLSQTFTPPDQAGHSTYRLAEKP